MNAQIGGPFALTHRILPSHHQHCGAVNPAARSQRTASPGSCRAASLPGILPHCCPMHSHCLPDGRSGAGFTLFRPMCELVWRRSHFPPSLPCMATGSASEQLQRLGGGGGGEKGWAPKPNDVERLHTLATRWWAQTLTTNKIMIKRQECNE